MSAAAADGRRVLAKGWRGVPCGPWAAPHPRPDAGKKQPAPASPLAPLPAVCKLAESAAMLAAIVRQHCCRGARHSYCAANLSDPSERQQAQPSNPSERRQLDPRQ